LAEKPKQWLNHVSIDASSPAICVLPGNPPISGGFIRFQGNPMSALYMIIGFIVVMAVLNIASTGRID
jgi:hypothetical protein